MPKDPVEVTQTMTRVRVVEQRGPAVVVEYAGGQKRAVVPAESLVDGCVSTETLDFGIPYGLPWEQLLQPAVTPETLAAALRAAGIWTLADIEHNPNAVLGALQAAYGVDLGALLQAARTYKP